MTHSPTSGAITVLLAEDHTIVREGLRALLESEADIRVVGEAADGRTALVLAQQLRPDVIIMDIAMPLLNGLEATRQMRKAMPDARVLILSAHSDDMYVQQAIAHGAAGYLLKQTSARVLTLAVREIHRGNPYFGPGLSRRWFHRSHDAPASSQPPPSTPRLSSREVEVLQLIAEGRPNKQVAAELGISIKTVEKHRQRLMEKLDIHDTATLTRYAVAAGVVQDGTPPPPA